MDRFATLQLFLRVVERGSFSQAARDLGIGQPGVSKQVAALEARLGTTLLVRTSRGLQPTPAGEELYEAAVEILRILEEAEGRIGRRSVSSAGLVRASIPPALGPRYIIPRLPAFLAAFPDLQVELLVSERHVDLVRDGIDVALRVGHFADSSLLARRIGSLRTRTVATPSYLARHGRPEDPLQLHRHSLLTVRLQDAPSAWTFKGEEGPFAVEPTGRLRLNDAEAVRAAVLADLGIAHDTTALFGADLKLGTVVSVLERYAPDPIPLQAVTANSRHMPRRLQLFVDFLAGACASEPNLRLD